MLGVEKMETTSRLEAAMGVLNGLAKPVACDLPEDEGSQIGKGKLEGLCPNTTSAWEVSRGHGIWTSTLASCVMHDATKVACPKFSM